MELDYGDSEELAPASLVVDGLVEPESQSQSQEQDEPEEPLSPRAAAEASLQAQRRSEAERRGASYYALPQRAATAHRELEVEREEEEEEKQDLTPPEVPIPIGGGLDVRLSALHLSGAPITQLSTSRLFALITQWGAAPLGLEWVNDSSCVVVFADALAALSALQLVSRPSYTPLYPIPEARLVEAAARVQGQHERSEPVEDEIPHEFVLALLTPRRTRAVPLKLYTPAERDALAAARAPAPQEEELPEDAPAIYAEMQAEEAAARAAEPAQVALRALRAPLFARFALDSADNKRSQAASSSKWYAQHGKGAGKDVVPRLLEVREKRARGRGTAGGAMMDDMDRELDELRSKREQEESLGISAESAPASDQWRHDRFEGVKREEGRQRGRRTQPRGGLDALDEELEEFRAERGRSASPVRPSNSGQVRIRGRGAMRSALAWADEDEVARSSSSKKARGAAGAAGGAGLEARLGAGRLADRFADRLESRFS